tara:strand:+ start:9987 stop:11708 length:1722 start_codon:yes stop_codon:yes gene_type:complete
MGGSNTLLFINGHIYINLNMKDLTKDYPELNERALGWLNFLYLKATTSDDWTEDGEPHEWWDRSSTPPMCSFPRFDLQESTYALGLMADKTPAWREVYSEILEEIAERSITYWAAVDWLSQFGEDPGRSEYPQEWKGTLIPEEFWGHYDAPGWTANGVDPWGMQPDPIGADGNLFFKGWLNLTQALHTYVSGEDKWANTFSLAGVNRSRFEWTQHQLVDHLYKQWTKTPMGPHCENTKAWPFCLSAAGLGLKMYDNVFGKESHSAYHNWLDFTKNKYYGFDKKGNIEWVTMYYDAIKEHHHKTDPTMGLAISFYAIPQAPEFAESLYRGAVNFLKWNDPSADLVSLGDPRMMALGLTISKEFDDQITYERLRKHAEENFEPRYFGFKDSQFGFWFNLGENWPRGQLSALAVCAEVCEEGSWKKLFNEPNFSKYSSPYIEGVDFPSVAIKQAWHDDEKGILVFHMIDGDSSKTGLETTIHISNIPNPNDIEVLCDGLPFDQYSIVDSTSIEIRADIKSHVFLCKTGYYLSKEAKAKIRPNFSTQSQKITKGNFKKKGTNSKLLMPNLARSCNCC